VPRSRSSQLLLAAPQTHEFDQIQFTSEPEEAAGRVLEKPEKLDVTIVSLKSLPKGVQGLSHAANVPLPSPATKAFVVGPPGPARCSSH